MRWWLQRQAAPPITLPAAFNTTLYNECGRLFRRSRRFVDAYREICQSHGYSPEDLLFALIWYGFRPKGAGATDPRAEPVPIYESSKYPSAAPQSQEEFRLLLDRWWSDAVHAWWAARDKIEPDLPLE